MRKGSWERAWLLTIVIYLLSCTNFTQASPGNDNAEAVQADGQAESLAADNYPEAIIKIKPLKEGVPDIADNTNALANLAEQGGREGAFSRSAERGSDLAQPIYDDSIASYDTLNSAEKRVLQNTQGHEDLARTNLADTPLADEKDGVVNIVEVPRLARAKAKPAPVSLTAPRSKRAKKKSVQQRSAAKRKTLSQIRNLYNKGDYEKITRYTFTSEELPQLYYKASAYFQLARHRTKSRRQQVKFVRYSKYLYDRIAATTRDAQLKGRSLLWLAVLRWRYPAWSEDLEQKLIPLRYIERRLKNTPFYNDALLYSGFIYQSHGHYDKAYDYYRKLRESDPTDLVYDDNVNRFTPPQRAAAWYLAGLEAQQLQRLATDPAANETTNAPPRAAKEFNSLPPAQEKSTDTTNFPAASPPEIDTTGSRDNKPTPLDEEVAAPADVAKRSEERTARDILSVKLEEIADISDFVEEDTRLQRKDEAAETQSAPSTQTTDTTSSSFTFD